MPNPTMTNPRVAAAAAWALAVFAAPFANPLAAQVTLGARAGATLSTLRITDDTQGVRGVSDKYGAHAALSLAYSFSDHFGVVVEGGYTQRGAELTLFEIDVFWEALWGFDYVDASVLGKVSLGPAYLLAGPSYAFRYACYTKIDVRTGCEVVEAVFRENDLLAVGGAGVAIPLGGVTVVAEGLYTAGLLDIDNEGVTTARHRGFVLRAGVDLRIR